MHHESGQAGSSLVVFLATEEEEDSFFDLRRDIIAEVGGRGPESNGSHVTLQ